VPKPEDQEVEKPPAGKARRVRFLVGADVGTERFEVGDTAPADVFRPPTRRAWLDQGLIEEVR
jgi:hypothetical protein